MQQITQIINARGKSANEIRAVNAATIIS